MCLRAASSSLCPWHNALTLFHPTPGRSVYRRSMPPTRHSWIRRCRAGRETSQRVIPRPRRSHCGNIYIHRPARETIVRWRWHDSHSSIAHFKPPIDILKHTSGAGKAYNTTYCIRVRADVCASLLTLRRQRVTVLTKCAPMVFNIRRRDTVSSLCCWTCWCGLLVRRSLLLWRLSPVITALSLLVSCTSVFCAS